MKKDKQKSIARVIGVSAAVMVVACTALLVWDWAQSTHTAPIDDAREKALELEVKTDAAASAVLTAERERQTVVALTRDSVNQTIGWVLLIAAAAFVGCIKWLNELQEEPAIPMDKLVELKAFPATAAKATAVTATPSPREATEEPEIDLAFLESIVAEEGGSREAAIPVLRAIQSHYGYLPDEALQRVCELTEITPAQIAGTSSFYAQFRRSPVGKHIVKICHGTACHVSGVQQITEEIRRYLAVPADSDTDPSRLFTLDNVACLGCCSLAPVLMIDDQTVGRLTPATACESLHAVEPEPSS